MPGVKRKNVVTINGKPTSTPKKQKTNIAKPQRVTLPQEREFETDSDPIVESDTTEHSGVDDGVSWPSDDEEDGGVQLPKSQVIAKTAKISDGDGFQSKSRESHLKQRAATQERKAAKPNADNVARSKKIWERLRRQSHVPLEERKKLVAELFEIISGRVKEFTLKHDAGRVIQTALKYGNLEQRKLIARELKGEYRQLAEGKYAKFTIGKLLSNCDDEIRDMVIPEFFGNVRRLIKHPEASWILDDIYRGAATKSQKAQLLREWYGAEFAIFKDSKSGDENAGLEEILAMHPEKRSPIMKYLFQMIDQLVQKKTTGFTMLHDAMLQYYMNVIPGGEEANDFVELLKGDEEGDLMKNLAFTPSGSRLVALAFARSTAKDRKLLLRTYKGVIETMAFDTYARRVLLSALEVIDDTVLTSKSIYGELIPKDPKDGDANKMLDVLINLNARAVILLPFGSNQKSLLTPSDISLLNEIYEIRSSTSKKDPRARRSELAKYLTPPLVTLISTKTEDLVQNSFGCLFIKDVLLGGEGNKNTALEAILRLLDQESLGEMMQSPHAGRMLKGLALSGRFNPDTKVIEPVEPPLGFSDMLWSKVSKDVVSWSVGANVSVVVGMLESQDFSHKSELRAMLQKNRKKLEEAAESGKSTESRSEVARDSGKRQKRSKVTESGNKGTQLLLKVLEG